MPSPTPQIYVFSRDQIRALDRAALDELGIPTIVLMENAAVSLCDAACRLIRERDLRRIAILCGRGNNGGDGLALARQLACHGLAPLLLLTAPAQRYEGDAGANLRIVEALGMRILDPIVALAPQAALEIVLEDGPLAPSDDEARRILIIDALLGTGLERPVAHPIDKAIQWANAMRSRGATILSVDIPSGIDCDTGLPLGEAIRADVTVTLAGVKRGLLTPDARRYTGALEVGSIGVPPSFLKRFGTKLDTQIEGLKRT